MHTIFATIFFPFARSLASAFIPRSFLFTRLRPVLRRTIHSHRPLPVACSHQPVFSLLLSTSVACGRGSGVIRSGRWWVFLHGPGTVRYMWIRPLRTLPLGAYDRIWHTSLSVVAPFATLFPKVARIFEDGMVSLPEIRRIFDTLKLNGVCAGSNSDCLSLKSGCLTLPYRFLDHHNINLEGCETPLEVARPELIFHSDSGRGPDGVEESEIRCIIPRYSKDNFLNVLKVIDKIQQIGKRRFIYGSSRAYLAQGLDTVFIPGLPSLAYTTFDAYERDNPLNIDSDEDGAGGHPDV